MIRYDLTAGYSGYYKSSNIDQIYSMITLNNDRKDNLICFGGKSKDSSDDCLEVIDDNNNSMVLKFVIWAYLIKYFH